MVDGFIYFQKEVAHGMVGKPLALLREVLAGQKIHVITFTQSSSNSFNKPNKLQPWIAGAFKGTKFEL